jgi:hypothetical protein
VCGLLLVIYECGKKGLHPCPACTLAFSLLYDYHPEMLHRGQLFPTM